MLWSFLSSFLAWRHIWPRVNSVQSLCLCVSPFQSFMADFLGLLTTAVFQPAVPRAAPPYLVYNHALAQQCPGIVSSE